MRCRKDTLNKLLLCSKITSVFKYAKRILTYLILLTFKASLKKEFLGLGNGLVKISAN